MGGGGSETPPSRFRSAKRSVSYIAVRFAVQLPTDRVDAGPELLSAAAVAEMARAAERAGFDAVSVTDHPMPPARWVAAGGHHSLDPFVALSFAAAATARLQLVTHVLVLPYRNPFLVAKSAATLDVLSGGRLVLGVAAGYLEGEFAALGADFAARNERTDEALRALRAAWSGEPVVMSGATFVARGNAQRPAPPPRPGGPPGPPLWIGGNAPRAIRRAVELGDGWLPFPAPARLAGHVRTAAMETIADLRAGITRARTHAAETGRSAPLEVGFVPFGFALGGAAPPTPASVRAEIAEYADAGVTWLLLPIDAPTRAGWCDAVAAYGEALVGTSP
jgi:probable F420-dependent oxidoreductase